jgi:hypothetical protein
MDISFSIDEFGRIVCDLKDPGESAVVTSSETAGAARGLLEAVDGAERDGCGECVWEEATGQYWWILRREGAGVTCAVMWSRGAVTGWQHVLRAEMPFDAFADLVRGGLTQLSLAPHA